MGLLSYKGNRMSAECSKCGYDLPYMAPCSYCAAKEERDHWIRLFNRLEAAVSRHIKAKQAGAFSDDADDALHDAHRKVMKVASDIEWEN